MASRHRSRERALQLLYQWETSGDAPDAVVSAYFKTLSDSIGGKTVKTDAFAEELFHAVATRAATLDSTIEEYASNWKLDRMAVVDRNILRLALYEMSRTDDAPAVIIDEAIELARRFSGEKASKFINGVLDAVRKAQGSSSSET